MKETLAQLLMQVRGSWRYRTHALVAAWACAFIGWGFVVALPDVYEARASVYVDTDSVLKPLLHGLAVNTDMESRVSMMARVMKGRTELERVARETDLAQRAHTPEQQEKLIDSLSREITLDGSGNVYSLRYSDRSPAMAQSVVQHLLDAFMEDTLGIKQADSGSAQQFLVAQIHDYEGRLRDAEGRLADFKRRNVGLMPGQESGDYFTRLQSESSKLADLESKLRLAEERRTELSKQLQGEEPTFGLFASGSDAETDGGSIDAEIANYRNELAQMLLEYTDEYPRVIALKQTIARLEAQKAAALRAPKPSSSPATGPKDAAQAQAYALDLNPVYQNLRLELSSTDVDVAELHEQIAEEERVVSDLKSKVSTIPTVEAQFTQLTRDYEVTKTQYQELLQRLDSARLSEQAEASSDQVKFRIIDPPTKPLIATGPDRPWLITGVLAAAVAVGVAVAVVLNGLRPVFLTRAMLASMTGLPVLGSISLIRRRRGSSVLSREWVLMGVAGFGLFAVYGMTIALADPLSKLAHALLG